MVLTELVHYLDNLLDVTAYSDYAPNGLQIQGKPEINTLVSGVTACQLLLDAAVEKQADAVLVHHGYFWKGTAPHITGMHQKRIKTLLEHDISLLAYHLPLDAHPIYGNNQQLAQVLGITTTGVFPAPGPAIAYQGHLPAPLSPQDFQDHLTQTLQRKPLHIPGHQPEIYRVGWCTGAGQDLLEYAAQAQCDAYITGEVSERTVHTARELGIHFFAAGHHATERYGVWALSQHIQSHFGVSAVFVDIDNPV